MKRILLAEDDPDILEILRIIFDKKGYVLRLAADGAEALEKVEEFNPDVVLLDIAMPKVNGYEVCKKIKSSKKTKHIKVVMLTALVQKSDIEKGYKSGADGYIMKPFSIANLIEDIRKALG